MKIPENRPEKEDYKLSRRSSKSIEILSKYVKTSENGEINASNVVSAECFKDWLSSRSKVPQFPEHAFRKVVSGHCRGDVGLAPFKPNIEVEVLKVLRRKKIWPCFKKSKCRIGSRGFQKLGYWENKRRMSFEATKTAKIIKRKTDEHLQQLFLEYDYYCKLLITLNEQYLILLK